MILTHGVGGGSDLPIPASYAVLGGVAALTLSFCILVMAWRQPRFENGSHGRLVPAVLARAVDSALCRIGLRVAGLLVLGFALWCAVAGRDEVSNPVFGIVYVLLWVGLVPASLLFGQVIRAASPARSLHHLITLATPVDRRRGVVRLPDRVGYWPAALGLLAFTWLELVSPDGVTLSAVIGWFVGYFVYVLGGALVFGERWFARADPFEVYATLVAHLSVWARRQDGALVVVSPLRHLAQLRPEAGLAAVVSVLLGSTAFDSFRDSTPWLRFTQDTSLDVTLIETVLLVFACLVVGTVFVLATTVVPPDRGSRWSVPADLAHSIVPIVVGYMVAHYLTLFVETGQLTLIQASDPLGTGMDLFGTAERQVDIWLSLHPSLLASVKVLAIVTGHILGVVAAHDRAIARLSTHQHTLGQLPLLLAMLAYTFTGLYLLFGL